MHLTHTIYTYYCLHAGNHMKEAIGAGVGTVTAVVITLVVVVVIIFRSPLKRKLMGE